MKPDLYSWTEVPAQALSLFRVLLGLILAFNAAQLLPDATRYFSDTGWLPRTNALEASHLSRLAPSLLFISGNSVFAHAILITMVASSLLFAFGVKPHLFGALTYILLYSIQVRNPLILSLGDALVRITLLLSLLTPLKTSKTTRGWATGALKLQVLFMYIFNLLEKQIVLGTAGDWVNGTAIQVALSNETMATPIGTKLLEFLPLLPLLTHSTILLEALAVPILIFLPKHPRLKLAIIAALALFHLGIASTLHIGIFPAINLATLCLFLPKEL